MTIRYRRRCQGHAALRDRLRTLVRARRRFGNRRPHMLGRIVNRKWLFRLYREERLGVRRRGGRKRLPRRTGARPATRRAR
jgi:putative transposase